MKIVTKIYFCLIYFLYFIIDHCRFQQTFDYTIHVASLFYRNDPDFTLQSKLCRFLLFFFFFGVHLNIF